MILGALDQEIRWSGRDIDSGRTFANSWVFITEQTFRDGDEAAMAIADDFFAAPDEWENVFGIECRDGSVLIEILGPSDFAGLYEVGLQMQIAAINVTARER